MSTLTTGGDALETAAAPSPAPSPAQVLAADESAEEIGAQSHVAVKAAEAQLRRRPDQGPSARYDGD